MIDFFALHPGVFFGMVGLIVLFFMGIRIVRPTQRARILQAEGEAGRSKIA